MVQFLFANRIDAGRQLAGRLKALQLDNPLILALPRGGVPVAHPIAEALGAEIDLLMVRKIGVPWQPEFALAAVVDGDQPEIVVNEDVAARLAVPETYLKEEAARQLREIEARRARYLGGRKPLPVDGRVVVVVDDGIATGATVRVALKALRRHRPAKLIVASPVAPVEAVAQLRAEADDVVCLAELDEFLAVGLHYADFAQVSDAEVVNILAQHGGTGSPMRPVSEEEAVVQEVRRHLLADRRVDLAHHPLSLTYADGLLVMDGEVGSLAAKRHAVAAARRVEAVREVEDRIRIAPARPLSDPEVRDSVRAALYADPRLKHHALFVVDQGRRLPVREPPDAKGEIVVSDVQNGVVTLRGRAENILARQMAGVAAWRAEGVREVVNELESSSGADRVRDLDQAVRLALDADAELRGAGVTARFQDGVVTLEGHVDNEEDSLRAESYAWMVDGVREVVNHVATGR